MALSHAFLIEEIQVGGMWEREARISWFLVCFFPFFFKHNLFSSTWGCNQSWMCDFSSLARWWFVLLLFTKDFIRLGEYSLMKHLVLCKFLLMAGKNVSRAWYTLDSEKASSRFLDWKLQLAVDENNSSHLPPYWVGLRLFLWAPISHPFAYCCAHFWAGSYDAPSVTSAPPGQIYQVIIWWVLKFLFYSFPVQALLLEQVTLL